MEVAEVRFGGCWRHPDRRRLQDKRFREGQRDLKFVPALELNFVLKGDVEAENCGAGFQSKENGALLGDIFRTAWAVDRERCVTPLPDFARHLGEGAEASPRAGSASGAVAESYDALGDGVSVAIH